MKHGKAIAWAALALLLIAEFSLFDARTSRNHAWVYPRWNDQIQYLTEAYTGHEYARVHGLAPGLAHAAAKRSAQGLLGDLAAVALFQAVGPSRSAALALNMLGWIALQIAFFAAAMRAFGRPAFAWAGLGLILCWGTPLYGGPGSAIDFRLDLTAACAFGISLAIAIRTEGLRSARWSALFGAAVGAALLVRFLSGAYFAVIFAGLAAWVVALPSGGRRLWNLVLAGAIAAALAAPAFWYNREVIRDYYFIGHFTGPEVAIRDSHLSFFRSLGFVADELGRVHFQGAFLGAAGAVTLILASLALGARVRGMRPLPPPSDMAAWLVPAALFAFAPWIVLALQREMSFVVVSIVVPGIAALLLGLWAWLWRWCEPALAGAAHGTLGFAAAAVVLAGGWRFVALQIGNPHDAAFEMDARRVNALADHVFEASRRAGLSEPKVAVGEVTDSLDGQVMRVICYERHRVWIPFVMTLPTGIGAAPESLVMERLAASDFVFLPMEGVSTGRFPFDEEMLRMRFGMRAWCEGHLRRIEEFKLSGRRWVLYGREALARSRGIAMQQASQPAHAAQVAQ